MKFITSRKFENILIVLMILVQLIQLFVLVAARESLNSYQIYSSSAYIIFTAFYLIYIFKKRKIAKKKADF